MKSCQVIDIEPRAPVGGHQPDQTNRSLSQNPPFYEKLVGDLAGAFSRRINIQRWLIYEVIEDEKIVKVIRMWTHYE